MKIGNRKNWTGSFVVFIFLCGMYFWSTSNNKNYEYTISPIFVKENLWSSDAKIWGNYIITNVGGKFCVYDSEGELCGEYEEIQANWIDGVEEDGVVIYGNFNNQIGIANFDEKANLIENRIVMNNKNLCIDPTIIKIDGEYYITITDIVGNVNNADPNMENGTYTIKLYKSTDLQNFEFVTDIITQKNNLEDADLVYKNGTLYIVYEMETYDKMDSAIMMSQSTDDFKKWSEPKELLAADCDHEPATVEGETDGSWRLYYSCDKNNHGESYMGADIYYAVYDRKSNLIEKDIPVISDIKGGKLLYDVKQINNQKMYLYVRDYITDNDLILEKENNVP